MYHDATNAYIDGVGATALKLLIGGTVEMSISATEVEFTNGLKLGGALDAAGQNINNMGILYFTGDKYLYRGTGETLTLRQNSGQATPGFRIEDENGIERFLFRINLAGANLDGILLKGDTNLYRSAADVLKTDDQFEAALGIKLGGALDANGQNIIGMGTANTYSGGSTLEKALSGDIVLECDPATAGTSAAVLNAAAAGTHTQAVTVNLKDAAGNLHKWASFAVNAATSEAVVDADVAAPTVDDATPDLVNGTVTVTLTYDTDEGVTKTYAAGDTVTLTISDPTDGILGWSVADATFVDTIVA
jgi:hypothetical protein